MRLSTLAGAVLVISFSAMLTLADDKPATKNEEPIYQDDFWGFSMTYRGLEQPAAGTKLTAFMSDVDERNAGVLRVKRLSDKTSSKEYADDTIKGLASLVNGTAEDVVECKLAGLKAWKSRMTYGGEKPGRHVLVCADAPAGEPFWSIYWQGPGATDEHEKLVNAAVESFTLHKDGEVPDARQDLQFCKRLGFSLVTAGFKGKSAMLPDVGLASASHLKKTADGKTAIGSILVGLANFGNNRKDGIEAFKSDRARFEKDFEFEEMLISGREAVRITSVFGLRDGGFKEKRVRLLIWDGDLMWEVLVRYEYGLDELPSELGEALDSFKLLKAATEK